jgi:hypothetical protein
VQRINCLVFGAAAGAATRVSGAKLLLATTSQGALLAAGSHIGLTTWASCQNVWAEHGPGCAHVPGREIGLEFCIVRKHRYNSVSLPSVQYTCRGI